MSLWKKLFNSGEQDRVDYYEEGLDMLRAGKFHEALTSFRLALRESPRDVAVLQQMAIAYTRIGMTDEALRTYRSVLEHDPKSSGAHYGMAFLLLKEGKQEDAATHLRAFLAQPPSGADAQRHIEHARQTLADLAGQAAAGDVS
ncbi:MAG TPA: tetratricopeptide repeat protein [Longimicrobiales bacterium]